MSPEKASSQFTLFPLGEDAIDEARVWVQHKLHSPDMQDTEIEKLKKFESGNISLPSKIGFFKKLHTI